MDFKSLEVFFDQIRSSFDEVIVDAFPVRGNSIYMQKRSATRRVYPNYWDTLGGHLEVTETLFDGTAREVFEESGLRLKKIQALVHAFRWTENPRILNLQFVCEIEEGELNFERDKNSEYKWIQSFELETLKPLSKEMKEGLEKAFEWVRKKNNLRAGRKP
jgi:8-oxo-dGTP diphosphatase